MFHIRAANALSAFLPTIAIAQQGQAATMLRVTF
jgi:hypothetical protein